MSLSKSVLYLATILFLIGIGHAMEETQLEVISVRKNLLVAQKKSGQDYRLNSGFEIIKISNANPLIIGMAKLTACYDSTFVFAIQNVAPEVKLRGQICLKYRFSPEELVPSPGDAKNAQAVGLSKDDPLIDSLPVSAKIISKPIVRLKSGRKMAGEKALIHADEVELFSANIVGLSPFLPTRIKMSEIEYIQKKGSSQVGIGMLLGASVGVATMLIVKSNFEKPKTTTESHSEAFWGGTKHVTTTTTTKKIMATGPKILIVTGGAVAGALIGSAIRTKRIMFVPPKAGAGPEVNFQVNPIVNQYQISLTQKL